MSVVRTVAAGVCLFSVGLVSAATDRPLVMLRFASEQTRSVEEWKGTARALQANPGCCHDVWFSTGESFPSLAWHRANVARIAVAAEDVRAMGLQVSLQFEATIGHGDEFPTDEEKAIFDKPWTGWTGPDGFECRYCNCPRQPGFLKRLTEVSELYATIRPAVVWLDDDLRVMRHLPVTGEDGPGCWCATCVADFAKAEGRLWTRESLHAAWREDSALRDRWYAYSVRSLAEVATVIARAFRKVSPTTRMGLQTAGSWRRQNEIVVRALAEATGEKVSVRLGGGGYYDLSPYEQIAKTRQMVTARRELALEDVVDSWCTEVETYPRAYGSRSARSVAIESFVSLGWGFDTVSWFVMDRRSETDDFYSRYLLRPLASVSAFLEAYREANRGTVPAGFTCPIDAKDDRCLLGVPLLPGRGVSWGEISAEREAFKHLGPVWNAYRPDLLTDFRKTPSARVQAIRDRVSGSAPLKIASPFVGLVLPRVDGTGDVKTVGLVGARLDPQEDIVLRLTGTEAVRATWRELGACPRELNVETVTGARQIVVPSLGAWNVGFVELLKDEIKR